MVDFPRTDWYVDAESWSMENARTIPDPLLSKSECKDSLKRSVDELDEFQRMLYANDYHSVLVVFQAMDAAGKDSTIRNVFRGVDPIGLHVTSFKEPSREELRHDFLWRVNLRLPRQGHVAVFNRSHYEEVLAVRVHPQWLKAQKVLPQDVRPDEAFWEERFRSIRDFERHLASNGTIILKFWLNVSPEEQKNRLLRRLDRPEKNWKFSKDDLDKRRYWDEYMDAYEKALIATSRPWAPWYAIPADNKPYMRMEVARTICRTLAGLGLKYPDAELKAKEIRALRDELGG